MTGWLLFALGVVLLTAVVLVRVTDRMTEDARVWTIYVGLCGMFIALWGAASIWA